jgi:hypothetical protein
MNKSLLFIPIFLVSCEKEVIEPAKYIKIINQGKPATVVVDNKKPFKLRLRKRKRRYEKINKTTFDVSSGLYKHASGCYVGSGDSSIRNSRSNSNPNH